MTVERSALFSSRIEVASYILAGVSLVLVLQQGLLLALLCGLLAYSLVDSGSNLLGKRYQGQLSRYFAATLLTAGFAGLVSLIVLACMNFFKGEFGKVEYLLKKVADIIEQSKNQLPDWLWESLPRGSDGVRVWMVSWIREHANVAKWLGSEMGMVLIHIVLGLVIGALIALMTNRSEPKDKPLSAALAVRANNLANTFRRIVFAQLRITTINATITAVFLLWILPMFDVRIPFSKTMVLIAFVLGIMPVIGNTISNTILVILGLSISLPVAIAAFTFMFVIHKFEYFLNAKIMGDFIQAKAWEMLLSMLVMEAMFGLPGVVAAPIFYGYLKKELRDKDLI